jgi:membrane protease YdiL (CAAX protease family)
MNNDNFNDDFNNQSNQNDPEPIQFNEWELENPYANGTYSSGYNRYSAPREDFYRDTEITLIDEHAERKNLSTIGFGYAIFSVISTAVALIIMLAAQLLVPDFAESYMFLNLLTPISLYLFALPVLLIITSKTEATTPQKRKMGVGEWLLFLIAGFGFMYIGAFIGNFVMEIISNLMGYDYSNALTGIIDEENIWLTGIFTVIVAPIGEEFVFRKLIIDRTHKYGGLFCVVLSALMFGLMHGNFYQFFYCFLLGLILGYIYYSTGKLHLTIIMHAVINFFGSVVTTWLSPVIDGLNEIDMSDMDAYMEFVMSNLPMLLFSLAFSLFIYASMACAVAFPIAFRKRIHFGRGECHLSRKQVISVACAGAGIITMFAVYLVEFALNLIPA